MIDRIFAYALFAGFTIAAALGRDWDDRTRQQPHERSQQGNYEGRGVVGRVHGEGK